VANVRWHQWWHVIVLAVTLAAAAATVLAWLGPTLGEDGGRGLRGGRVVAGALAAAAALLLAAEWLAVHGRFL
jgi:hypothetical protein